MAQTTKPARKPSDKAAAARDRARAKSGSSASSSTKSALRKHDQVSARKALAHRLYLGETSYDFMGNRKKWYIVSAVLLTICLLSLAFRGLNLGIEFKGGTTFTVPTTVSSGTVNEMGRAVERTGLPELDGTSVVTVGSKTARVQTRSLTPAEVVTLRTALAKEAGVAPDKVAYSTVGASWGKQVTEKGIQALVVFLVLVGLMIWAYFRNWKMSIAALVALLHDLIITVGVYSILGFTVSPSTLIGVLTILGYSLYDTVVVFDKVRENVRNIEKQDHTYSEQSNLAINQVLVRSLNTTIIGVLPVAALLIAAIFFMGPGPLEDLGLALLVGMIAGAYSSIFIAAPLNAQLREREPEMREHSARLGRRSERLSRGARVPSDKTPTDSAEPAIEATGRREVVVNPVGEEEPWELEGVEFSDAELLAEDPDEEPVAAASRPAPRDRQTARGRHTAAQRRRSGRGGSTRAPRRK